MISTGKGVEQILGRKRRRPGGKKAQGKDLRKEKGEGLTGGKGLGGKEWEGSKQGKEKDLREEKEEDLGWKRP